MPQFRGFPEGKVRFTSIPAQFFRELLPQIDHLGELKVILYTFWRLERMEGAFRYLRLAQLTEDEAFMDGFTANVSPDSPNVMQALEDALERCVRRGTLLKATIDLEEGSEDFYFLNSPKGRSAVQAIARGEWRPSGDPLAPLDLSLERPNVFRLYEENIGPLTPLIADRLRDAEDSYPAEWIEDAIRIAVENNVRRWSYIDAILASWREEGRDERKDRRDTQKDRRRYVEGEFSEFIEH